MEKSSTNSIWSVLNTRRKNERYSFKCSIPGCNKTNLDYVTSCSVPGQGKEPKSNTSLNSWRSYKIRQFYRNTLLTRCKIDNKQKSSRKRICSSHKLISVKKYRKFTYNKKQIILNFMIEVPEESEIILQYKSVSKGLGTDRYMANILKEMNDNPQDNEKSWAKSTQHVMERNSMTPTKINPSVLLFAGLSDSANKSVETRSRTISRKLKFLKHTDLQDFIQINPHVSYTISDDEIRRMTGFVSKKALMSFVIITCNGDPLLVNETKTYLTWFEEWILYFRFV